MSGYRSLHREQALPDGIAAWSVETSPWLLSSKSSAASASASSRRCWRVWCGGGDGLVRALAAEETSLEEKHQDDALDASAMKVGCTHVLLGPAQQQQQQQHEPPQQQEPSPESSGAGDSSAPADSSTAAQLGCSRVGSVRNYVGDDATAGDLVVVSLDLAGRCRVWSFPPNFDDNLLLHQQQLQQQLQQTSSSSGGDGEEEQPQPQPQPPQPQPRQVRAKIEFEIDDATGTTAELCPPRLFGVGAAGDLRVAVGCLDGTVSMVATGLSTPTTASSSAATTSTTANKKEPTLAGTLLDSWGSRGSSLPLSLAWHPSSHERILAVGRQDGTVDLLTQSRKRQHRLARPHRSPVRALAYSDDGTLLVAGSDEGLLCVWDVSRPSTVPPALVHHVLGAHDGWILALTMLSDSRRFVTAGADKRIHVWNIEQMNQGPVHTFQSDRSVYALRTGPSAAATTSGSSGSSQQRLVAGSDSGWIQVYSLE